MVVDAQWVGWSASDPFTTVGLSPDLVLPKYLEAFVVNEPDLDVDVRIKAVFDVSLERYVADSIEVRRRTPAQDVTGSDLRAVRVQDYLRQAARQAMRAGRLNEKSGLYKVEFELEPDEAARVRSLGPSSVEALTWTARIYKFAAAVNEAPAKAVQDQLGLSVPTASVWIRRARDLGLLIDIGIEPDQKAFDRAREIFDGQDWPI